MNILMIAINDPAGTAISFTNAVNKYTEHSCRLITKEIRYNFMFEKDIHLPWLEDAGWEEVETLLKTADIFHFHMTADEDIELGPFRPKDYLAGKRILHHHHGHPEFRSNPDRFREKYRRLGRQAIVSTPDLLKLMPEASWQPNLVPIDAADYLPVPEPEEKKIMVCHAPTRKDLKNTSDFVRVMKDLMQEIPDLACRVIENTAHADCLRIKQRAHIHFDHMQGYYGVSSLESLSQGRPVIAGIDDWNRRHILEFSGQERLPWVIARNQDDLEERIRLLALDKSFRKAAGSAGRHFMENGWSGKKLAGHLAETYARL